MESFGRNKQFAFNENNVLNSAAKSMNSEVKPKSALFDRTNNVSRNTPFKTRDNLKQNIPGFQGTIMKKSEFKTIVRNVALLPFCIFVDPVEPTESEPNFMEKWAEKEVLADEFIDRLTDNAFRMDTPPPTDDETDDEDVDYISLNDLSISMVEDSYPFGLPDDFNINAIEVDEEEYIMEEPSLDLIDNDVGTSLVPNFYLDEQSFSSFEEDDDCSLYISTSGTSVLSNDD